MRNGLRKGGEINTQKKRIFIADDQPVVTRLLKLNPDRTRNCEVPTENDARLAVAAAEQFRPDLILMDVLMPGIDGGDLASRMQVSLRLKEVPIVFLTGAATKDEVSSHGGKIGGLPFLAKPVGLNELLTCLQKYLYTKA